MTGYRKGQDSSGWIGTRLKRGLIIGISLALATLTDALLSPATQGIAQSTLPNNAAFSALWHIATIGSAAAIIWAILRKVFGW